MSEWWTYRLSDFLMFSARTYHRLFELYNAEFWPAQIVALGLGLAVGVAVLRAGKQAGASGAAAVAAFGVFALAWGWVGWAFHLQRYATINWAALWFGMAFVVQALLLLGAAWRAGGRAAVASDQPASAAPKPGLALLLFALFGQPLIGLMLTRPWHQAEVFGFAPDPTVSATLGLLLMLQPLRPFGSWSWVLWPLPLLWCVVAGATAWAMAAPDAWLMPTLALLALAVAWRGKARSAGSRKPRPA